MTDKEISIALAKAIGWPEAKYFDWLKAVMVTNQDGRGWFEFDYRDPVIAFRVAEHYDCFPIWDNDGLWYIPDASRFELEMTPQRAIAMCVINGAKK